MAVLFPACLHNVTNRGHDKSRSQHFHKTFSDSNCRTEADLRHFEVGGTVP